MPVESKTIKVEISSVPMTERRFSQYPTFKLDGVVASTVTDNSVPTIARMEEITEGLFFYERVCMVLSSYGITVKMLTDTSNLAVAVPSRVQLELTYNPSRLPLGDEVMGVSKPEVAVTMAAAPVATREELVAIGNIVWEAVKEPEDVKYRAKWNGPAIKLSTFAESKDHTISKPYNVLELITKEYTATDYVASMQIKEV